MDYEQKIIRTNGIALNVIQAGPQDGTPIFLLHGFPEYWYGWRHQIEHLVWKGFRVWVPDQRGYNLSDKPEDVFDYRMDELVMDTIGLINAAGVDKANIVGHDWGAVVLWWLALRHPERVNKMAILNVPHPRVFQRHIRFNVKQILRSLYAGFFLLPALPEMSVKFNDSKVFARLIKATGLRDTFSDEDMEKYREAWAQPHAVRSMINWYRAYARYNPAPPKSWRIKPQTLILWGLKDKALSSDLVEPSYDLCDNAELVTLEKATHWVQHDEKERVNQLLGMFFS
jgi:epoxide hydrolase 4